MRLHCPFLFALKKKGETQEDLSISAAVKQLFLFTLKEPLVNLVLQRVAGTIQNSVHNKDRTLNEETEETLRPLTVLHYHEWHISHMISPISHCRLIILAHINYDEQPVDRSSLQRAFCPCSRCQLTASSGSGSSRKSRRRLVQTITSDRDTVFFYQEVNKSRSKRAGKHADTHHISDI